MQTSSKRVCDPPEAGLPVPGSDFIAQFDGQNGPDLQLDFVPAAGKVWGDVFGFSPGTVRACITGLVYNGVVHEQLDGSDGRPICQNIDLVLPAGSLVSAAGFLIIDEDSIDNGILYWPNGVAVGPDTGSQFSDTDVNDDIAEIGVRSQLRFFARAAPGTKITLQTGEVGDEGWFTPETIPHHRRGQHR